MRFNYRIFILNNDYSNEVEMKSTQLCFPRVVMINLLLKVHNIYPMHRNYD